MIKKSIIVFMILTIAAFGACACWGYTVSQWPAPGIPNTVYGPGSASLGYNGPGSFMPGNVGYGGYGGYNTHGGGGWYGYPGSYGGYGGGYHGQGWGR